MNLRQANDIHAALASIADQPLAGEVAERVVRLRRWALPHYTSYTRSAVEIASRHGEQQSDTKWVVKNEAIPAFTAELQAMGDAAVEPPWAVDFLPRAALAALRITPCHLEALGPVLGP